jgi:hypothetical protein
VLSTISVAATARKLPDALTTLYRGRQAGDTEMVQSATDALIQGYGLALAGSGVALVLAAVITVVLVNAKRGQVSTQNVTRG